VNPSLTERVLVARGRLIGWSTIVGLLVLWVLGVTRPLTSTGAPLPLLNTIELCILTVAVTQVHRPWCRRHILGLWTAVCVQMVVFLALYGLWTGNLWVLALRLATLNLVTAAALPWGIAMQSVVAATSTLAFALVHWNLNGTLDHPSTVPTLILFVFSLPFALWLNQAHANLASEIDRRETAESALRRATESANVAVWDADLRALTVRFGSGWKGLLGRDENEIALSQLWDLIHPDDRAQATVAMQEHLQGRASIYETEQRMLHTDGSYRWVLSRGIAAYDADGRPHRLLGADIDITDRKHLEEALQDIAARKRAAEMLRESEERFRGTFDQAAVGIAHVAPDGRWLRVNRRLCDIVGYSEQELRARTFQDITHPDDLDKDLGHVRDMLDGKIQTYSMEKRYLRKDGSVVWVDLTVSLVREPSGRPKYFISVVQDIEVRKRAESALRESEERFSNAFEHAPIAMAVVALDGRTLRVNHAMCQMFGYGREEMLAMRPWDVTNPEDMLTTVEQLQRMVLGETDSWLLENRYRHKLGHEVWGLSNTSIVRGEDGTPLYVISQVQNITERRHAEQMQRRHERATATVNNILRAINTHLDAKVAFPEVCAGLRELAGCAAASVNLFDERREWLRFVAADAPWALGVSQDVRLGAAEFPAVTDVLAGRPHVVRDLATELQFPIVRTIYAIGFRSVISVPLCVGNDVGGFLTLFWRDVDGCNAAEMGLLTQVANAVAIAVEKSRLFEQVRAGHERLAALSRRLIEVQETERRHLARELHDEIGQTVTGMRFLLDTINGLSAPMARARLEQVQELVNDLVTQIRDLSLNLRPSMLDDFGLMPALVWLFGRYTAQTNVRVDFNQHGLERRFDPDIETVGYRVVQEALTNVARHARVDHVGVRGWVEDSSLFLEVVDDGTGFDPDAVEATTVSMGLAGMRERALQLAGLLTVESKPGAGTHVRLQMPVSTEAAATPRVIG
jgi:PAS domain S-box-containing protein